MFDISELTKRLKLPTIQRLYDSEKQKATETNASYEEFLYNLLLSECDARQENQLKARVKNANFSQKKYLDDLDLDCLPLDGRNKLKSLKTLDFLRQGQNVILAGNPGTGKTHIATGLGILACLQGLKVWYVTVPTFVTMLKESASNRTLRQVENRFASYDLVILDELGYISFDREGAELLFTNLSLRAGIKSTIITTNLSFDNWKDIFVDPVMAAAITDRLTHRAYLVNMHGESYRLKETKDWIDSTTN